jgi:hypothetical protein
MPLVQAQHSQEQSSCRWCKHSTAKSSHHAVGASTAQPRAVIMLLVQAQAQPRAVIMPFVQAQAQPRAAIMPLVQAQALIYSPLLHTRIRQLEHSRHAVCQWHNSSRMTYSTTSTMTPARRRLPHVLTKYRLRDQQIAQ